MRKNTSCKKIKTKLDIKSRLVVSMVDVCVGIISYLCSINISMFRTIHCAWSPDSCSSYTWLVKVCWSDWCLLWTGWQLIILPQHCNWWWYSWLVLYPCVYSILLNNVYLTILVIHVLTPFWFRWLLSCPACEMAIITSTWFFFL